VVYKEDLETGKRLEPIEEVMTEIDDEFTGQVIEELTARKGS